MTPEEAVIGACLLDSSVIPLAVQHVMPSDFEHWIGGDIYQAIIDLHAMHQPVDVITVLARLRDVGSKVATAYPAELHRVMEEVPSAGNVDFYAAQVREAAVRRSLKRVAVRLAQDAENEMMEPGVALAGAVANLKTVRDDAPDQGGLAMRKLSEVMREVDSYDWIINRLLERGDRLIITGFEGRGKSMLMRQMAIFAAAGIHPFYLTPLQQPVRVMVIDRENTERQWRRKSRGLWSLAQRFGNPDFDVDLSCDLRPMDITRDSDLGKIHRRLDEHPADLLFLGPLY
jgi:replicative DNA helicase